MSIKRFMVFVNKSDRKGRKAVKEGTTKVLASYNHALLVQADDVQLALLRKLGYPLEAQGTMIKLRTVQFDTSVAVPQPPQALAVTPAERPMKRKRDFWLVQFAGPIKAEWGDKIKALGAKLGDYVPENAFLIGMSTETAEKVRVLPFVTWIGVYEPAYKVSPLLMGQKRHAEGSEFATRAIDREAFKVKPEGNLTILLHKGSNLRSVVKAVKDLGGDVVTAEGNTIRASLNAAEIDKIAKMVNVKWIEPYERPVLSNDVAAQIMQVQPVWNTHGLDGKGQTVAVVDSGIDTGVNDNTMHADFRGRIVAIHDRVNDGANDVNSGHGTHVAGSVLGNGTQSNGAIRGMAPVARLVFQAIENNLYGTLDGVPADYNNLFQEAYTDGARIHTNSWGTHPLFGQYTAASEDIDEFMWNHKDSIILFAAGNAGVDSDSDGIIEDDSITPEASSKNCITVGASESNRPHGSNPPPGQDIPWATGNWAQYYPKPPISTDHVSNNPEGMAAFSSRGPTDDGRPKPDVVAPGTNILSVRSSVSSNTGWGLLPASDPNRPFYKWGGGTSMATPLTAGTVALIRQYIQNAFRHTPSGALLKAMLIHGAVPITGQYTPPEVGAVPDNSQGWGRVNLMNSLYPVYPAILKFYDDPAVTLGTGDQRSYTIPIKNTTVPFRATLVWTDFPSSPTAAAGLYNELRMEVIAPNGTSVLGNPANNNVQHVVIARPQTGNYTVRISGINIRTVASRAQRQDFALVVSAGFDFIDLYIKANPSDDGTRPLAGSNQSPDISWQFDSTKKKALIFVKVHNRGTRAARNANVRLFWKAPDYAPADPRGWKKDFISVNGRQGNSQLLIVPAHSAGRDGEATTAAFELDVDSFIPKRVTNYLIATVSHTDDPTRAVLGWDNNLATKVITVRVLRR